MTEAENKIKKEYEMAYLLTPDIAEEKLDLEIAEFKKIISENGGEIIDFSAPQRRRLAYPIKKQNQAYFGTVYFNMNVEEAGKIRKGLALNKKILRYLILNEPLKLKPSTLPIKVSDKSSPVQSFNQKLESILNG